MRIEMEWYATAETIHPLHLEGTGGIWVDGPERRTCGTGRNEQYQRTWHVYREFNLSSYIVHSALRNATSLAERKEH
jgi:hypothetical protein